MKVYITTKSGQTREVYLLVVMGSVPYWCVNCFCFLKEKKKKKDI